MRIAFLGNQDNNAYRICTWIRERGIDAHLYMIRQERGPRSRPEVIDVELADGYPPWIREYDDTGRLSFLKPSKLAQEMERQYDVVVTSGVSGLLAANHFHRLPVVHLTLGSEISKYPFLLFSLRASLPWRGAALLMRRGLARVKRIITHGYWGEMRALARLGLLGKAGIWGIPEDPERNRSRVNRELLDELNRKYGEYDGVFVWLSRLNFLDKSSGAYKAADTFLDAFERFALSDKRRIKAIVGTHGEDVDVFRRQVIEKGLASYVDYVPHLPFWKLLTYASIANGVVVEVPEMERGHILSGLAREALSVGAVVIAAQDNSLVSLCYGEACPIMIAYDVQTCYEAMARAVAMSEEEFQEMKRKSLDWAGRCLHYDKHIAKLLYLLRETVFCERFRK